MLAQLSYIPLQIRVLPIAVRGVKGRFTASLVSAHHLDASISERFGWGVAAVSFHFNIYVSSGLDNSLVHGGGVVTKIALVGIGELRVTWQPPSSESVITGYTATASAAGQEAQTCTATEELTCAVRGLFADVEYAVTVTATNRFGTSAPSESVTATPHRRKSSGVMSLW